jgi:hypothetical protein
MFDSLGGNPLTGGPVADFSRKPIYAIVEAVDKMLWMDGTSWAEFLLVLVAFASQ